MYKPLTETNPYYNMATRFGAVALNPSNDATEAELQASRDAAKAIYTMWRGGYITTEELAREHVRLIAGDVDAGYVPWDVWDFSALHNYVDANCYSLEVCGLYIDETDEDQNYDLINACQARVSEMLCGTTQAGYHEWRADNRLLADLRQVEYHVRQRSLNDYLMEMGKDVNAE